MSVKRYQMQESSFGPFVAYKDYLKLDNDYAALLARHNALREAVKWMLYIDTPENFEGGKHIAARAEVDRLLEEK